VVEQLLRSTNIRSSAPKTGPDAFVTDLLINYVKLDPIYLLSASNNSKVYKSKNIEAHVIKGVANNQKKSIKLLLEIKILIQTMFIIINYKPNRILCGRRGPMLWASFLYSKIFKVSIVHSRHEVLLKSRLYGFERIGNALDQFCIKRCKAVICHGPYLRDQLKEMNLPDDKIFTFDVSFKNDTDLKKVLNNNYNKTVRTLLYVGRMESAKGIFDLYYAFKELLSCKIDLELVYIGKGRELERLRSVVRKENLIDKVKFKEYIPHSEIFEYMKNSYLVITPTRSIFGDFKEATEARCMTAIESLYVGTPVIGPGSGPFPYIIKNGINGMLYRTNSQRSLYETIKSTLINEKLYSKIKYGAELPIDSVIGDALSFSSAAEKAFALSD